MTFIRSIICCLNRRPRGLFRSREEEDGRRLKEDINSQKESECGWECGAQRVGGGVI